MFERIIKLIEDDDITQLLEGSIWQKADILNQYCISKYKYKNYELVQWSGSEILRIYQSRNSHLEYNNQYSLHTFKYGDITPAILREASKIVREHERSLL